jgi:hypothetical protein
MPVAIGHIASSAQLDCVIPMESRQRNHQLFLALVRPLSTDFAEHVLVAMSTLLLLGKLTESVVAGLLSLGLESLLSWL